MSAQGPSEEELIAALRQVKVDDVVVQTVATLVNLAGQKLTIAEAKDVTEAKKAIDAARAMLPLCPEEAVAPIKDALSQVQMIYVREAPATPSDAGAATGQTPEAAGGQTPEADAARGAGPEKGLTPEEEAARAKARAKIWTPGS